MKALRTDLLYHAGGSIGIRVSGPEVGPPLGYTPMTLIEAEEVRRVVIKAPALAETLELLADAFDLDDVSHYTAAQRSTLKLAKALLATLSP